MDEFRGSTRIITMILLAIGIALSIASAVSGIGMKTQAIAQQQNEEIIRLQETAESSAAPVAHTGNLPNAVINGTTITYSHLTGIIDNNIITGDVPAASGTFEFTGSGLVFHKRSSEPFTVTYTIDAAVRPLTQ